MDRPSGRKSPNNIVELNYTITQLDITNTHRPLYPTIQNTTFFSCPHGTFTKTNFWPYKINRNKFNRIDNGILLGINNKDELENPQIYGELTKCFLCKTQLKGCAFDNLDKMDSSLKDKTSQNLTKSTDSIGLYL